MGFGEAALSSPYSPSPKGDATRPGILRQALASPFGIWGTTAWWFQELSKWRETMPPIAQLNRVFVLLQGSCYALVW
ncbi:hypothetical protein PQG02_28725 [Nostoc sp. UHCC 0926]|uniref:hypothetical protein n=1 Tax=unclassified Nostoc TaxID=2593658 RepID=UPI0023605F41|nr:hypothetical protein [Nostoc sp. UHCC 0926]WDD32589.1 hypothetical protein PQG02_28725 [Nostoc sp. UHCC 0926]